MKITPLRLGLLCLSSLYVLPASAQSGLYLSAGLNSTTQEHHQTRNTGSNQPNMGAAGGASASVVDKDTGIGFYGAVGYQLDLSDDFFAAIEGFYAFENAQTTVLNNVKSSVVEIDSSFGADLKFGTKISNRVGIYGLISATAHKVDADLSYTFADPTAEANDTVWGLAYGAGVNVGLTDRISTFGEIRLSNDLNLSLPPDAAGIQSVDDLDYTVIRTGLRYHF